MSEQLSYLTTDESQKSEYDIYLVLYPTFLDVLAENNIDDKYLKAEKKKGYTSITLDGALVARICLKAKSNYFSISRAYCKLVPDNIAVKADSSGGEFIRLPINMESVQEDYADFFKVLLNNVIDRIPKEFDCCSRYEACSDAKKCVHPDRDFAMKCGYKQIMNHGKIFYGKNRNVE